MCICVHVCTNASPRRRSGRRVTSLENARERAAAAPPEVVNVPPHGPRHSDEQSVVAFVAKRQVAPEGNVAAGTAAEEQRKTVVAVRIAVGDFADEGKWYGA